MNGILHTAPNKLGARQTLVPSAAGPGPLRPILQVSGRHEHARHLNIVLAPVISDPSRGPVIHPCIAVLSWGAGGASTRAEVDFARGTELQLAAAFVSISGRNDAGVDDGSGHPIDGAPGPQDVVAIISGVGSRSAFGRVTRTFYFGTVGAGQSRLVPVPPFAKTFAVTRLPGASSVVVTVFDGLDIHIDEILGPQTLPVTPRDEYRFTTGVPAQRIDLYDRAGAVQVTNPGPAAITNLQISFELCL